MQHIFIVEDDTSIRELIGEHLRKWGYTVTIVEQFDTVDEQFAIAKPHLVLLDVNLPSFDGYFWCQKLRQTSNVPILFISSRQTNMDMVMAMNMGADDYIPKPFAPDVLVAKVQAILRRTYAYTEAPGNHIEYNGARLNLENATVQYNEAKIELTKNELKILHILMKQHGKIVSREKLMKALWDMDQFIDENTLTVNVNRLRKRLQEIGIDGWIETKKGQGYMLL